MRRYTCLCFVGLFIGACGLEMGGPPGAATEDGGTADGSSFDAQGMDVKDASFDIPDLGTGETEAGIPCDCVPPPPKGWRFVSYNGSARPACPEHFQGAVTDTVENPTAQSATCSCACNGFQTPPACTANITVGVRYAGAMCKSSENFTLTTGSTCTTNKYAPSPSNDELDWMAFKATPPQPTAGTCNAPTETKNIPAPTASNGRTCALTASAGSCGGGVCVPKPASEELCIQPMNLAPSQCPGDYPKAHRVGSGIADTRACGPNPCTCTANHGSCTTPTLTLFSDNNCMNVIVSQAADDVCRNVNLGDSFTSESRAYASTSSGASCGFNGTYQLQGGLDVKSPTLVCCR